MTVTTRNFAIEFCKTKKSISYKTYMGVAKRFFLLYSEAIIKENFRAIMPYGLGELFIKERKSKKPSFDFGSYNKTGVLKRYTNLHTFGRAFSFFWKRRTANCRYKTFYRFRPVPDKTDRQVGSRGLSNWINKLKEKNIDYTAYNE